MKTFEEKWTAWLDGQLTGKELVEFEDSLPDRAAAEAEKRDAKKLGSLLKQELGVSTFTNAEFFSHQLNERIAADEAAEDRHVTRSTWWSLPRLAWAGAASLAMFVLFTVALMRDKNPADQSQYLSQILNARVDPALGPNATITMFESKEARVTVLWTEGLQSLPSDFAAK
ncbi:MAG: hypothetical protein ABJB69_07865 [Spartobacteria bacterium]